RPRGRAARAVRGRSRARHPASSCRPGAGRRGAAGRRGGARRGTWEPAAILAAVARPSSLPPPPPPAYARRAPRMRVWRALLLVVLLPGIAAAQDAPTTKATFQKGVDALKAGRLDEAEAAFRRVLQQGDTHAYVHNNLAIVYQQQGRHAE